MPAPVQNFKKLVFKRLGEPDLSEPPPKKIGMRPYREISELEKTILANTGGKLEILEAPEKPEIGEEQIVFQARQLAQVEHLMYQGVRSPHLIAQALKITEKTAEKYVKAVLARWQVIGSDVDMKAQRGEALGYMDFLQNQLWTQFTGAKNIADKQAALPASERDNVAIGRARALMLNLNNQIITLNAQRNQLYGLTPQAIQQMLILGGNEDHEVLVRMRKQQGMKELASKLGTILLRQRQANAIEV